MQSLPKEIIIDIISYLDNPIDIANYLDLLDIKLNNNEPLLNNNDWVTIFRVQFSELYTESLKKYDVKNVYYGILINKIHVKQYNDEIYQKPFGTCGVSDFQRELYMIDPYAMNLTDNTYSSGSIGLSGNTYISGSVNIPINLNNTVGYSSFVPVNSNVGNVNVGSFNTFGGYPIETRVVSNVSKYEHIHSPIEGDRYYSTLILKRLILEEDVLCYLSAVKYLFLNVNTINFSTAILMNIDDPEVTSKLLDDKVISCKDLIDVNTPKSLEHLLKRLCVTNDVGKLIELKDAVMEAYIENEIDLTIHRILCKYLNFSVKSIIKILIKLDESYEDIIKDFIEKLPKELSIEDLDLLVNRISNLDHNLNFYNVKLLWIKYSLEDKITSDEIITMYTNLLRSGHKNDDEIGMIVLLSNLNIIKNKYL